MQLLQLLLLLAAPLAAALGVARLHAAPSAAISRQQLPNGTASQGKVLASLDKALAATAEAEGSFLGRWSAGLAAGGALEDRHPNKLRLSWDSGAANSSLGFSERDPGSGPVVITASTLQCGVDVFAPWGRCPTDCPFYAEDTARPCYFKCVHEDDCARENPTHQIADGAGYCRPCRVQFCSKCIVDGSHEKCETCSVGYRLNKKGRCESEFTLVWWVIYGVLSAVIAFVLAWVIDKAWSPVTNEEGLQEGLAYRSSLKLHVPKGQHERSFFEGSETPMSPSAAANHTRLWPLGTNMHFANVAGPGWLLHMNFQLFSLIWVCLLATVWIIFAYRRKTPLLLSLGLFEADTPVEMCMVTVLERELMTRLMTEKVLFLCVAYAVTFFACMIYAMYQRRVYLAIDDQTSMRDYAALCTGLPPGLSGEEHLEDVLKEVLEQATGEEVVGVSICWNYHKVRDIIHEAAEHAVVSLDEEVTPPVHVDIEERPPGPWRRLSARVDLFLGFCFGIPGIGGTPVLRTKSIKAREDDRMKEVLHGVHTTDSAFVVFRREHSRDDAVQALVSRGGEPFRGGVLQLQRARAEPEAVSWDCFHMKAFSRIVRVFFGFGRIFIALLMWFFFLYLPYAYFRGSFSYAWGEEPGALSDYVFSLVVTLGNAIMYAVCFAISERVGFRFTDQQQALYIFLYIIACLMLYICDLMMEFAVTYKGMVQQDVHAADGTLISRLPSMLHVFQSYPMQNQLGQRLLTYCFPGTFLLPYIMEGIFAIYVPYQVQNLLVRTHPEIRNRDAEVGLSFFFPLDMSRYGDILLNMWLTVVIFFFPTGLFLKIFLFYVLSHFYIYLYDSYKALRCVPSFWISGALVERFAQAFMAFPCAALAACIAFKSACLTELECVEGHSLLVRMGLAFVGHLVLHWFCLFVVLPIVVRYAFPHNHKRSEVSYSETASENPRTWFALNPVHCLRSEHIYGHDPPCSFWVQGKEHLIRSNPKIGVYFEDHTKAMPEHYPAPVGSAVEWMKSNTPSVRTHSGTVRGFSGVFGSSSQSGVGESSPHP